jgi:hypothetical protein
MLITNSVGLVEPSKTDQVLRLIGSMSSEERAKLFAVLAERMSPSVLNNAAPVHENKPVVDQVPPACSWSGNIRLPDGSIFKRKQ